jgi:hypothetical protein
VPTPTIETARRCFSQPTSAAYTQQQTTRTILVHERAGLLQKAASQDALAQELGAPRERFAARAHIHTTGLFAGVSLNPASSTLWERLL